MKKARERIFWARHDHRNQHLKAAASSVWTGPWQDRVHHESVRDQIKWRLSGPHHTLLNYWLLVHSGRKAVTVFTCVPRDAPTEFQRIIWNSLVIQKSLVKLSASHDKTIQQNCGKRTSVDEELTEVEVSRIHSTHEQYCQGSYNAPLKDSQKIPYRFIWIMISSIPNSRKRTAWKN